jgi:hypothetical protein
LADRFQQVLCQRLGLVRAAGEAEVDEEGIARAPPNRLGGWRLSQQPGNLVYLPNLSRDDV